MKGIKTIIFDLGGVIVDLDVSATVNALSSLAGSALSHQEVIHIYHTHPAFQSFEKGIIDETTFRQEVRELLKCPEASDADIDLAWNAMLKGLPKDKLDLLQRLKNQYHIIILSNTNSIHIADVYSRLFPPVTTEKSFLPFAHRVYYSHEIKLRKPDKEIYEYVLTQGGLNPAETMFLDDNEDNITSASQLGIGTTIIRHPDQVLEIFK